MATIIDQIIQIDSIAQNRLDEVNLQRQQRRQETKQRMEETNALIRKKASEKINAIETQERQNAEKQKEELRLQKDAAVLRLEQTFEANRKAWEQEIYQNILNR